MKSIFATTRLFACLLSIALFVSCEDDDPVVNADSGTFSLELTDAPIDDADVSAVFVTVADVRVDGQSVAGFSKTTVELSALQNGVTETLVSADLEAKTYAQLQIVLDEATDAAGNAPGCYVMTSASEKVALNVAGDGTLNVPNSIVRIAQGATTATVIDFDLRKALVRTDDTDAYDFAAEGRLVNSLRFVDKSESGTLSGTVENTSGETDGEVVVYAYAAGTYGASEATGDEDDELFLNAVSSARLSSNGEYKFNFLPGGDYELVAASYKDDDQNGEVEMMGTFSLNALLGLDLGNLSVEANTTTSANFTLTALLP